MKLILLFLGCTLVHIPSIIMRYEPFKEIVTKKQKRMLMIIYATALFLNLGLYYLVWTEGNISIRFYKYNILFFCIAMALVNSVVIRHRVREHLFTFGLTALIVYLMLSITAFFQDKLQLHDVIWQITMNAWILCVLFVVLYPLLVNQMRRTITPFLSIDSHEYWKNVWFLPIAVFFASLLSYPMSEHIETLLQLISRLILSVAAIFICRGISYDYRQFQKREELSRSLDRQKEYYAALSEKVEEARKLRHDFKHHITILKAFVDKKDYAELSEYICEMSQTSIAQPFIPFTQNSAADGIIYHYVLLCQKENISFETKGMLHKIQVSDIDLCVLLGNALDNAYTACLGILDNRFIKVSFCSENGVLTVAIQNSFDGIVQQKKGVLLSRKRTDSPGIGLTSMKDICEKYGGNMKIGYDDKCFTVIILLNSEGTNKLS